MYHPSPNQNPLYSPNRASFSPDGRRSPNPQGMGNLSGGIEGRRSPIPMANPIGMGGMGMDLGRRSPNPMHQPLPVSSGMGIGAGMGMGLGMGGGSIPNSLTANGMGGGSGFEVERATPSRPSSAMGRPVQDQGAGYSTENIFREVTSRLIGAKTRPASVSGRIPLDTSSLVLFFRSKTNAAHSLDFPIDLEYGNPPPALDVLIASCKRTQAAGYDGAVYDTLHYPSTLPLTPSLELANHPIIDAVRNTLFPSLPVGHHLVARRDHLEVLLAGGHSPPERGTSRADGRVATLSITLPARFQGGALSIRDLDGHMERLLSAAPNNELEWTAWLSDAEVEVEPVGKGCRMALHYALFALSFAAPAPGLFVPSQPFMDLLPPVLQMARGRKVAFLLSHDYESVDPSVSIAESLVPYLKGGDSVLYTALKTYRLAPALHWSAGGYIWPVDRAVELFNDGADGLPSVPGGFNAGRPPRAAGGTFSALQAKVEASGAVPFAAAEVTLLTDYRSPEGSQVGKSRVYFVQEGLLEKLVVNVLIVAYVP